MNKRLMVQIVALTAFICSAVLSLPPSAVSSPVPGGRPLPSLDLYTISGSSNLRLATATGTEKPSCEPLTVADRPAVKNMVEEVLGKRFSITEKSEPTGSDILAPYKQPAFVIVGAVCRSAAISPFTIGTATITVTGYDLQYAAPGPWLPSQTESILQKSKPTTTAACVRRYNAKGSHPGLLTCTSGSLSGSFYPNPLNSWSKSSQSADSSISMDTAISQLKHEDWSNLFGYSGLLDAYVLRTNVNSNQRCATPSQSNEDIDAVEAMIANNMPSYTVRAYRSPPIDILASYVGQKESANVVIATICRTRDVYNIALTGYAFKKDSKPLSGSLSGSFDALETADWSTLFGSNLLFPTAAFLPIANDSSNIINARLAHNLPVTVIATPAAAPVAPPPPGAPAPPQPPATRLAECQASAFRTLIVGRTTTATQRSDITRLILAGAGLKSTAQAGWGTVYNAVGTVAGLVYIPNSAQASAAVFVCPPPEAFAQKPALFNTGPGIDPNKVLFEVGGLDHFIVGHKSSPAIGLDPYTQQNVLDDATVDLENQLDCVITKELARMNILNVLGNPPELDYIATKDWCTVYFDKLEKSGPDTAVGGTDAAVTIPVSSALKPK